MMMMMKYSGSGILDPESGSGVLIRIRTPDPDHILLGGRMWSLTALVITIIIIIIIVVVVVMIIIIIIIRYCFLSNSLA